MDRKSTLIAAGALAGTLVAGTATIALTGDALRAHDRGPGRQGGWSQATGQPAPGQGSSQAMDPSSLGASLGLPDPQTGQVATSGMTAAPEARAAQQPPVARSSASGEGGSGVGRSSGGGWDHEDGERGEHERDEHGGWGEGDD